MMNNGSWRETRTCKILGVNICAMKFDEVEAYLSDNIDSLRGKYITVANVHTTVTAYKDDTYRAVQNGAILTLPDGGPLSSVGRRRGFSEMERITGPDLMYRLFKSHPKMRHFFYGSTEETLQLMQGNLKEKFPDISIAGVYSPPFRPATKAEDEQVVQMINETKPDIIWIGLGAPKQERWMADHQGSLDGVTIGVGAGFDYFAGNIKRAPKWMQKHDLEWLYRLIQDPNRLWKRYLSTNISFIINAMILKR